jgi:uracil-DNA glycosylase
MRQFIEEELGTWYPALSHLFNTEQMRNIGRHIGANIDTITPSRDKIFAAFKATPIDKVRVVLIGQDPYPAKEVANGLAFSTSNGSIPYSLKQVFLKLKSLYGIERTNSDLSDWAKQGVLLLNPVLTTLIGQVNAHNNIGWQFFTKAAVEAIPNPVAHLCWGSAAWEFSNECKCSNSVFRIHSHHPASTRYGRLFYSGFTDVDKFLKDNYSNEPPIKWA